MLVSSTNVVLDVPRDWTDPSQKNPKTIHHRGPSGFAVDGEMLKMRSRMPRGEILRSPGEPGDILGMSVNVIAGSKIENGDPA